MRLHTILSLIIDAEILETVIWNHFLKEILERILLKQLDYSLSISVCGSWLGLRHRQLSRDGRQ